MAPDGVPFPRRGHGARAGDAAGGAARRLRNAGGGRGRARPPGAACREFGAGALVLGTYPVEHFAAARPNANPEATWRLYRALGVRACVRRAVGSSLPEVLVDRLLHRDGSCHLWAVTTGESP